MVMIFKYMLLQLCSVLILYTNVALPYPPSPSLPLSFIVVQHYGFLSLPLSLTVVQHYGIFPKSLAEVAAHYQVQELHLTLTQGQWRTRMWGYSSHPAPPGAELWAWFLPGTE